MGLALPQAERQRDGPASAVAPLLRGREQSLDFLERERLYRLRLEAGRTDKLRRTASEVCTALSLAQRGSEGAVDLVDGGGPGSSVGHPAVDCLDVLGLEGVQPQVPDHGEEVLGDRHARRRAQHPATPPNASDWDTTRRVN